MATLSFKINAEWDKVQKLREEIAKLKQEIKGTDAIQNPVAFNNLNSKLQQTSKELGNVTNKVAQTVATVETDFKKKIFDASQSVNGFTEKIIAQKAVVKDVEADVRRLGDAYRDAKKYSPMSADGKLAEWKAAKRALEEEKAALFGLTQEQANARLSVKKLRDEYALFKDEGGGTAQTMDLLTSKMKSIAATVMGGMGLKELASHIISVRGEFESMETSLKVLLGGNQQRLDSIMGQIKEYALASPLNTKDMVGAVQMMTSFGIEAEKSIDYLKAIGDISMGDTGKFNSLALAFSQMSSAGKLMGQDLLQMVNAGFNPLEEISRKTGKSIGELKEEMSKGAISAKMVQDAFISATSAGGKFYGMGDKGSKTLNGQISMLQESFDNMFNEIGTKGEGVVMTAVQIGTKLVENYEQVGKVLAGLVVTYGAYKTALVLSTQMTNGMTMAQVLHTTVTKALTVAEEALNKTILSNPYVLAAVALGTLITAVVLAGDSMTAAERAQDNYNKKIEGNSKLVKDEKDEIDKLIGTLEDETSSIESKNIAFSTLISKYPAIFGKYKTEKDLIDHLTEARQRENAEIERKTALLGQKSYNESKTRATELNRLKYLQKHGDIKGRQTQGGYKKGKDQDEYLGLWNKYHDDIKKTQTWYGTEGGAIDRLASVATEEYKLNINENRKSQIAKYNANVGNLSKAQGQKELARLRSDLKKMDKSGKDYLKIGNNEPLSREQIKERMTLLKNNIKTERKTMAQWRKDAEQKTKKNRKAAKNLASSTELLTKDQAEKKMKAANDALTTSEKSEKNFSVQDKTADKKAKEEAKTAESKRKKAQKQAEAAAQRRQKEFDEQQKFNDKEQEEIVDAGFKQREAKIATIQDNGQRERKEYQLQYDKTIQQIRKEAESLQKETYEHNKSVWENSNTDKSKVYADTEEGKAGWRGVSLTDRQEAGIQAQIDKADAEYDRQRKAWAQADQDAMTAYLKEYGSMQEKKLAITQEYDEKIRKAVSVGEKATLEMQRDKEIEKAKNDELQSSIDWNGIFSDLQGHTKQYLQGLRNQLHELLNGGNLPIDQMQTVSDKINAIDDELGEQQGIWDFIGERTREHNRLLKEAADAQDRLNVAKAEETKADNDVNSIKSDAQKQLSDAGVTMNIGDISTANLNGKIDLTDEKFKGMAPILQRLAVAEGKLTEARKKTLDATNKAKQAEDAAKRKPAQEIADWFSDAQEFITKKGIDQIPDLLGSVGMGKAGDKAQKGLDGFNSAAGAVADYASGNYVGAALKGISAIKSFGSALGIGGGNGAEVAKTTERLTKSNEELAQRIDDLTEVIGNSAGEKAVNAYDTVLKAQKEINQNSMEILKAQMGYHSAHHSNAYYADDKNISSYNKDAQLAFKAAGVDSANITGLDSIYSLSPEQLKAIRDFAPNLWKYLTEVGKYDKKEYWDNVVEQAGKTEKLTKQIQDNLTQTSFDTLRSSFLDTLMDMDADTQDWSENFSKMLFKSLVNKSIMGDEFDKWLKGFQEKWAEKVESGNMSQQDYADYRAEYDSKMQELKTQTNNLASAVGYDGTSSSQKATANGISSITYEQANSITALTTAGNISRDQIKDKLTLMNANIEVFKVAQTQTRDIADELRTIQANSYIELQGIHEDTTSMNKAIKTMSGDVADIKKHIKDM